MAWGMAPAHGTLLSPPQVQNLLKPICTGVTGSELGRGGAGTRLGSGEGSEGQPIPPHCPDFLSPRSQLIPLQTPLKTLLQIAVMPMLNGRVGGL